MVRALGTLIEQLRFSIRSKREYPSRPQLYRRFDAIAGAARLISKELLELQILPFLLEDEEQIQDLSAVYRGLLKIAARAEQVAIRHPPTRGRGQLIPRSSSGPDTMDHCALIVGIFWQKLHGRWPPKRNAKALGFCEAVWQAANGPPRSGWGARGSVAVWANHIVAAQAYRAPHQAGALIEYILSERLPNPRRLQRGKLSRFYRYPRAKVT